MAFVITKDHLDFSDEGTVGPRDAISYYKSYKKMSMDDIRNLIKSNGQHFRMYDDDGELYYEGYFYSPQCEELDYFQPLDAFGMPNAGCTTIKYRNDKTNKYEEL